MTATNIPLAILILSIIGLSAATDLQQDFEDVGSALDTFEEGGRKSVNFGRIAVGQIFRHTAKVAPGIYSSITLHLDAGEDWLRLNFSSTNNEIDLYGIPQVDELGPSYFTLQCVTIDDEEMEVELKLEVRGEESFCGREESVHWLDVLIPRGIDSINVEEQIELIEALYTLLASSLKDELKSSRSDFRLLPHIYLSRQRSIVDTEDQWHYPSKGNHQPKTSIPGDHVVISLNISCAELDEYAADVIDYVAESQLFVFRVIKGVYHGEKFITNTAVLRSTTESSPRRTTRWASEGRPTVVQLPPDSVCERGRLCTIDLGENLFYDAEDGGTSKLTLELIPTSKNHSNFLMPLKGTSVLEGVPLESGVYSFRLVARNRANKSRPAPFQVTVKPSPSDVNHQFSFLLETSSTQQFVANPENFRNFTYQLSRTLRHLRDQSSSTVDRRVLLDPASVQINEVVTSEEEMGKTWLRWSNAALLREVCEEELINQTKAMLVRGRQEEVKHSFKKSMGTTDGIPHGQFHVSKIVSELLNSCLARRTSSLHDAAMATPASTTEEEVADDEGAHSLLVPLVLAVILIVLLLVLLLLCCVRLIHRRSFHSGKGKKLGKQTDFTSKGHPVVFPEEVPQHEEADLLAVGGGITTPMLVAREQPPLDPVQRTTLYENPLYKPPQADLSAARLEGGAKAGNRSNNTSTFHNPTNVELSHVASAPHTSSVSLGARHAPAAGSSLPVGQRPPPTYTAAI